MNLQTQPTILLIEDDNIDAMLLKRCWQAREIDAQLVRAYDGIEALQMLRGETGNAAVKPLLILLDLNMPRMNGLEFLDELRRDPALRHNVAMVLSTSEQNRDVDQAFGLNAAGYFIKSFELETFERVVDMIKVYLETSLHPTTRIG